MERAWGGGGERIGRVVEREWGGDGGESMGRWWWRENGDRDDGERIGMVVERE